MPHESLQLDVNGTIIVEAGPTVDIGAGQMIPGQAQAVVVTTTQQPPPPQQYAHPAITTLAPLGKFRILHFFCKILFFMFMFIFFLFFNRGWNSLHCRPLQFRSSSSIPSSAICWTDATTQSRVATSSAKYASDVSLSTPHGSSWSSTFTASSASALFRTIDSTAASSAVLRTATHSYNGQRPSASRYTAYVYHATASAC